VGDYSGDKIEGLFALVNEKLDAIHEQTAKTNGRVTVLEDRANKHDQWRWFITGGLSIITIIVLPMLYWIVSIMLK
jgi:hypothetical protein